MEQKIKNRLKELRIEKDLTQEALAKELGVSLRTIQKWENSESNIRTNNAHKIAKYFGVSVGYLLGYEGAIPPMPHETYTPREEAAWIEYHERGFNKTKVSFETFYSLRKQNKDTDEIMEETLAIQEAIKKTKEKVASIKAFAKKNDITDNIEKVLKTDHFFPLLLDYHNILTQIKAKETFSSSEITAIKDFREEVLFMIDNLYYIRIALENLHYPESVSDTELDS